MQKRKQALRVAPAGMRAVQVLWFLGHGSWAWGAGQGRQGLVSQTSGLSSVLLSAALEQDGGEETLGSWHPTRQGQSLGSERNLPCWKLCPPRIGGGDCTEASRPQSVVGVAHPLPFPAYLLCY